MKIGLLGMGTVGGGVRELAERLPDVKIARILERVHTRPEMTNHIENILRDDSISLIVETMGGLHPAYEFAVQSLESGRHFVTANKLLVSAYGRELQALARRRGVGFLFGAACGGGIPYLSNLAAAREGDHILRVGGILNGTTNYMLDAMQTRGLDYAAALREAQALGYAEQDPTSDVEGLDTLRKLILAVAVGMRRWLREGDIPVRGISGVLPQDIAWAREHGFALRLCAFGAEQGEQISACVEPAMCPLASSEASVTGNLNQAWYEGAGLRHAALWRTRRGALSNRGQCAARCTGPAGGRALYAARRLPGCRRAPDGRAALLSAAAHRHAAARVGGGGLRRGRIPRGGDGACAATGGIRVGE